MQQFNAEQTFTIEVDQPGKANMTSDQPLIKGKETVLGARGKKTRKNAGSAKGKSKVIATGHKVARQEAWLKRGTEER